MFLLVADREVAMWDAIAADESAEEWERDPELMRRMKAVREAERWGGGGGWRGGGGVEGGRVRPL